MDAHHPYAYDESHKKALGIGTEHIRNPPEEIMPGSEVHRAIIDSYDTIHQTDEQIGRLIKRVSDDTIIPLIFCQDTNIRGRSYMRC